MSSPEPPLIDLAAQIVSLAHAGAPAGDFQKALHDCFQASQRSTEPERESALSALVPALAVPSDNHAFAAAMLCGALVEAGCTPAPIEGPSWGRGGHGTESVSTGLIQVPQSRRSCLTQVHPFGQPKSRKQSPP